MRLFPVASERAERSGDRLLSPSESQGHPDRRQNATGELQHDVMPVEGEEVHGSDGTEVAHDEEQQPRGDDGPADPPADEAALLATPGARLGLEEGIVALERRVRLSSGQGRPTPLLNRSRPAGWSRTPSLLGNENSTTIRRRSSRRRRWTRSGDLGPWRTSREMYPVLERCIRCSRPGGRWPSPSP